MLLQSMMFVDQCPTVSYLIAGPLDKYIHIVANYCEYGITAQALVVTYIHLLFLKAKSATSQEENMNWRETTTGLFADNYWEAMKVDIATFESMGNWYIVDRD